MSDHDDLIARLRKDAPPLGLEHHDPTYDCRQEAADAIAALIAERDEAQRLLRLCEARTGNPADIRYWEGRYRDEAAEVDRLKAERDAAHALLREVRRWMPRTYSRDPEHPLNELHARIDALLAGKEGTT